MRLTLVVTIRPFGQHNFSSFRSKNRRGHPLLRMSFSACLIATLLPIIIEHFSFGIRTAETHKLKLPLQETHEIEEENKTNKLTALSSR